MSKTREIRAIAGYNVGTDTKPYGERSVKPRVFVTVDEDEIPMERPPYGSSRGDGSAEDKLWRKYNKLERDLMRAKAEAVLGELGITAKLTFSRTAGCSCPCSPGFVLDSKYFLTGFGAMWIR